MKKINVALIFGGKSGEHEVSLQSAKSIYEALDKNKYNVQLVGIDKQGNWLLENNSYFLLNDTNPKLISLNKENSISITPVSNNQSAQLIGLESNSEEGAIDIAFPIIHGTNGEDGTLQGMLELLNVAYVGAGVLGSAVGMDKDVMKRLLHAAGIPTARFFSLRKFQLEKKIIDEIADSLGFPVFVKPANLGSSVGISKAHNREELDKAIAEAFTYDTKILFEECITGREIEISVLGNDNPKVSLPGEVIPTHEFYDYEAKYIDEKGAALEIPAKLDDEIVKRIQELAIHAFQALECSGMARVDLFLTPDNKLYINEINTLPGFTKISMYPKLWEASGLPYSQLLDELITLAIEKKEQKNSLKRTYE